MNRLARAFTLVAATLAAAGVAFAVSPAGPGSSAPGPRFQALDTNRNGTLERGELAEAAPRLAARFERIDRNADQRLDPRELRTALRWMGARRDLAQARGQAMRARFAWLDTDGDRALSRAELGEDAPRLSRDFTQIDTDRDGRLGAEELRAHWRAEREARRAARQG